MSLFALLSLPLSFNCALQDAVGSEDGREANSVSLLAQPSDVDVDVRCGVIVAGGI